MWQYAKLHLLSSGPAKEDESSLWDQITYRFVNPALAKGFRRPLDETDIPGLPPQHQCAGVARNFADHWAGETNQNASPSLARALRHCYGTRFAQSMSLEFFEVLLGFMGPILLQATITACTNGLAAVIFEGPGRLLTDRQTDPPPSTIFLPAGVDLDPLHVPLQHHEGHLGELVTEDYHRMDIHSSLVSQVYRYSLIQPMPRVSMCQTADCGGPTNPSFKLSKMFSISSSAGYSRSDLIQLQGNDCLRVTNVVSALNVLWTSPLTIIVAITLLVQNLGLAGFAGVGVMLVMGALSSLIVNQVAGLRDEVFGVTDHRTSLMSEILAGIKLCTNADNQAQLNGEALPDKRSNPIEAHYVHVAVSLCAVSLWAMAVMEVRARELQLLKKLAYWHSFASLATFLTPLLTSVVSFTMFAAWGGDLNASTIFSSMALFNMMRGPLSYLPIVAFASVDASVSLGRIESFLAAGDLDQKPSGGRAKGISIRNGEFRYGGMSNRTAALTDVNLQ
eukprot:gene1960-2990_t